MREADRIQTLLRIGVKIRGLSLLPVRGLVVFVKGWFFLKLKTIRYIYIYIFTFALFIQIKYINYKIYTIRLSPR